MGYGDTYSRESTKEEKSQKNSLISCLCDEAGYNRENLEGIELESKIDLRDNIILTFGENLDFPEPYSRDKILKSSKAIHSCYAFVRKNNSLKYAFTKVEKNKKTKIKLKENLEIYNLNDIILMKRDEKHLGDLSKLEVNKKIAEIARQNKFPLEYVGKFTKESKEAFVFNPTYGRIFVIATNICTMDNSQLYQLEAEYYGQINGFTASKDIDYDLANLIDGVLKQIPKKYHAKTSKLTKFDWLVQNIK